ncbi:hypothetical protein CEP48_01995 [Mergibacter septicus]|uniref:Uncharacterized protein n=1 Tax=Mergibacter septicus TaxID=221402 RepID=A0A8E3MFB1_9PAST|nr:YfcZ/YiiS family protein [Mergibacter septicus]AWX15006.1 hypothetical protein CEP47_01995 [Mergibacter septicus]QDJ14258.1 hypothetical protein CEP48_01995 [Mergibacter septicus]UTU48297.1 YfcZ/YiiS family protein [Mergibacter septicus]WMR96081.1 YfcZ/YiiS family protein [Mergibacter septicus]
MSKMKCKAEEAKVCCCVDVGTVIDNEDCGVDFSQIYSTQADAEQTLAYLTEKARNTESEPCQITSDIKPVENGYQLTAHFLFCCQAESMIFQLSTR